MHYVGFFAVYNRISCSGAISVVSPLLPMSPMAKFSKCSDGKCECVEEASAKTHVYHIRESFKLYGYDDLKTLLKF